MPHQLSQDMRQCVQQCTECRNVCMETVAHCLQMGGAHAEAGHIRLLLDCAEICATSAAFMLRGSDFHAQVCGVCASVCDACAQDCEQVDPNDHLMRQCAETCRRCAGSCGRMAQMAA